MGAKKRKRVRKNKKVKEIRQKTPDDQTSECRNAWKKERRGGKAEGAKRGWGGTYAVSGER